MACAKNVLKKSNISHRKTKFSLYNQLAPKNTVIVCFPTGLWV